MNLRRLIELVRRQGTDVEVAGDLGALDLEVRAVTNRPAKAGPQVVLVVEPPTPAAEVREALRRGVTALVAEEAVESPVPVLRVPHAREALRHLLAALYGEPPGQLLLWGVTGPGRTSVAFLLHRCLADHGLTSGLWADVSDGGFPAGRLLFLRALAEQGGQAAVLSLCPAELGRSDVTFPSLQGLIALDSQRGGAPFPFPESRFLLVPARSGLLDVRAATVLTFGPGPRADLSYRPGPVPPPPSTGRQGAPWLFPWGQEVEFAVGPRLAAQGGERLPPASPWQVHLATPGPAARRASAAASAAALTLGVPPETVFRALSAFPGVWRRLQLICQEPFAAVDDVAQTPREVAATLAALGELGTAARRLGAVRPYRRLYPVCAVAAGQGGPANAALGRTLVSLLPRRGARRVIVTEGRDHVPPGFTCTAAERTAFVGACRESGLPLEYYPNLEDALTAALGAVREGDLLLLLGGSVLNHAQAILGKLLPEATPLSPREPYEEWEVEPWLQPLSLAQLTREENLPGSPSPRSPQGPRRPVPV